MCSKSSPIIHWTMHRFEYFRGKATPAPSMVENMYPQNMYLHWRPKKWWYMGINLWKCMRQPGEVLRRSTSSREKSANWLAKGWAGVADVADGRLFKELVEPENLERLDFKWPTNEPWNLLQKKNVNVLIQQLQTNLGITKPLFRLS